MNWYIEEKVALMQGVADRERFVLGRLKWNTTQVERNQAWKEIAGTYIEINKLY